MGIQFNYSKCEIEGELQVSKKRIAIYLAWAIIYFWNSVNNRMIEITGSETLTVQTALTQKGMRWKRIGEEGEIRVCIPLTKVLFIKNNKPSLARFQVNPASYSGLMKLIITLIFFYFCEKLSQDLGLTEFRINSPR